MHLYTKPNSGKKLNELDDPSFILARRREQISLTARRRNSCLLYSKPELLDKSKKVGAAKSQFLESLISSFA